MTVSELSFTDGSAPAQDIVDKWMTGAVEIAAGDLRDQLDDGTTNPVWTMRGNTQVSLF